MIAVYSTDGTVRKTYPTDTLLMTLVAGVLTISNLPYPFVSTDTFVIYTNVPRNGASVGSSVAAKAEALDSASDRVVTYTYAGSAGNYRVATKVVSSVLLGTSYTDTYAYLDAGAADERVSTITRS